MRWLTGGIPRGAWDAFVHVDVARVRAFLLPDFATDFGMSIRMAKCTVTCDMVKYLFLFGDACTSAYGVYFEEPCQLFQRGGRPYTQRVGVIDLSSFS